MIGNLPSNSSWLLLVCLSWLLRMAIRSRLLLATFMGLALDDRLHLPVLVDLPRPIGETCDLLHLPLLVDLPRPIGETPLLHDPLQPSYELRQGGVRDLWRNGDL